MLSLSWCLFTRYLTDVYLKMVDVLLCIQINTLGLLLYGHDRQTHVNAAMKLALLHL